MSPAYVQRMVGHIVIRLTVDFHGRWLPMANKAAVVRLDEGAARRKFGPSGSKVEPGHPLLAQPEHSTVLGPGRP